MKTDCRNKVTLLKRFIILSLITLSVSSILGQNKIDCIAIQMKNGNKVYVPINEYPKIQFMNQIISIGTNQYLISNISKYTFENYMLGIDNDNKIVEDIFSLKDGHFYVKINNHKSLIKVYSVDGKELDIDIHVNDDGVADIYLGDSPIGIYLLSIDGEILKIQCR